MYQIESQPGELNALAGVSLEPPLNATGSSKNTLMDETITAEVTIFHNIGRLMIMGKWN
jgi:hypothetical protein